MKATDLDRFVGIEYDAEHFDCADLVVLVQKELFGRSVSMPDARPRGRRGQASLGDLSKPYGSRTISPVDGDLVLMTEFGSGRAAHAGVFFRLDSDNWVLHANSKNGYSVLHRVNDLPGFGASIEGFYSWV